MAPSRRMTVTTVILATIKRLLFGAKVRRYVDGREVPNFRSEVMKTKEKVPMGKGKGKGKPKC